MRAIFSACLLFIFMNCFSQFSLVNQKDTVITERIHEKSFSISYRMLPSIARYEKRYRILKNYNDNYHNIEINYSIQNFISAKGYNDSSLLSSFKIVSKSSSPVQGDLTGKKEILYGAWRNKVTAGPSENEIAASMSEGTLALIDLGYKDFGNDFLPFISGLMEEQHIVNYDNSRTKAFGRGSRGAVTSLQILHALNAQNTDLNFGVCRDVHEMGRMLLKTMAQTWYDHYYPDVKPDFDDHIFLQSWTTNKSQHVTISFIDPIDTKKVYELDWGRVIEKTNNAGYDNGRLYGNTYRIWRFDKRKNITVPVDFRRTHFGKILDENILSREEYLQFNGIYDEEFYSSAGYTKEAGGYGALSFSLGTYNPAQHYFLAGWHVETKPKKIISFLNHSSLIALQGAVHEDTRKKEFLYPQVPWQFAASIMGIPRIVSKFGTSNLRIADKLTFNAWFNQQFDAFLIGNSFYINDSLDRNDLSGSGDGNLTFSNGFNVVYKPVNRITSSVSVQARSALLPGDIRLFTPNIVTLIPNLHFVTPAIDASFAGIFNINQHSAVSANGMFEFTNLGAILFSGSASAGFTFPEGIHLLTTAGITDQFKGMDYFWYPVAKKWVELKVDLRESSFSLGILKYPESTVTCNLSFRRYLK